MKKFLKSHGALLLILLIAFVFRFWQISHLPGGLYPDEAANGLDINLVARGQLQPFYERGNGREALFFYFLAATVGLFGRNPFAHHLVSAGFGFAAVLLVYFLAKKIFGKNVALLAAFFMATSSYAVTVTRTAFRANTVPFFSILTFLLLILFFEAGTKNKKFCYAAGGAASLALGFYTYTSFRMMIPLLLLIFSVLLLSNRDQWKKTWKQHKSYFFTAVISFLIFIAPLAAYFAKHPSDLVGRVGQVSVFNKDLNHGDLPGTVLMVFKKTMLAFFTDGDLNWRHNISGFPFLSPFLGPFFAFSLVLFTVLAVRLFGQIIRKKIDRKTFYTVMLAAWFWAMLAPEVATAEGIPHGLRLTGVIPAIFIISAWGADQLWKKIKALPYPDTRAVLAVIFLSAIFLYDFYLYFGIAARSPDYYYAFRSDLTTVSQYLNARNEKTKTYLSLDLFSAQTVEYLTTEKDQPYILVDPANTYKLRLNHHDQVVFTQSTIFDRLKFIKYHPKARLVRMKQNQFGQIIMLVYEQQ